MHSFLYWAFVLPTCSAWSHAFCTITSWGGAFHDPHPHPEPRRNHTAGADDLWSIPWPTCFTPASMHQEAGIRSQACSCSSSGSQQNALHHGGVTGLCRGSLDHSRPLDSRSSERTARMHHVLSALPLGSLPSAPALTPHSPFVKGPCVPIPWDKDTRHRGSVTQGGKPETQIKTS